MRTEPYVIFIFCIILGSYLMGYSTLSEYFNAQGNRSISIGCEPTSFNGTAGMSFLNSTVANSSMSAACPGTGDSVSIVGEFIQAIGNAASTNPLGTAGVVVGILALLGGFASMFLIPALMLFGLIALNVFIMPFGWILSDPLIGIGQQYGIIGMMIMTLWNLITIFVVLQFIRGSA